MTKRRFLLKLMDNGHESFGNVREKVPYIIGAKRVIFLFY